VVVGPAGAIISAGTGEFVGFQAGTFAADTNVSLAVYAQDSLPPAPDGHIALSHGIELQPSGVIFTPPAVITFSYTDAALAGADPSTLGVWVYLGGAWQFLGGTVDTATHTVTISVSHFTLYVLMGDAPRGAPPQSPILAPLPIVGPDTGSGGPGALVRGIPNAGIGESAPSGGRRERWVGFAEMALLAIGGCVAAAGLGRRRSR
jgi:hypothetical protein